MKTVTIQLSAPFEIHGKKVTEVRLKEPTGLAFIEIGDPRLITRTRNGDHIFIEDKGAIADYLDRCIDHETGKHLLAAMSLADAQKLKDALYGFFAPSASETPA